jgi:limonene-1,2-epoxide hydrolase
MSSSSASPLEIVLSFLSLMEAGQIEEGAALIAPQCEYANPGVLPTVYGPEGVTGLLGPFFAPVLENQFQILRTADRDGVVFVERIDRHRLQDRWVELPVTGVFEVREGRITLWRDYFNGPTILDVWPK